MRLLFSDPLGGLQDHQARAAWQSPLASEGARVAQLLRRTTFGVRPETLETALSRGFQRTLDAMLEAAPAEPPGLISPQDPTRGARLDGGDLQKWWLEHMLKTPTPLAERMTAFWHGHFTSSLDKVGSLFIYWQNLTWRRLALGGFGPMLREVTKDPAMLTYLDLASSDASDPAQPPNENYARELMELFTLGPGNYTEADVKSAARALAGWTTPAPDTQVEAVVDEKTGAKDSFDVWYQQKPGVFNSEMAYGGEVTYLKKRARLGLDGVIDQILAQPTAATFLTRKVAAHFISPVPDKLSVRSMADGFRASAYDVKALVRAVLTSPQFSAPASYRSLVKSPLEFMVGAAIAVGGGARESAELIVNYGDPTGESPFQPPTVAGWPQNSAWISPSMMLARFNFVSELLDAVHNLPSARDAERIQLDGVLSDSTRRRLDKAGSDRERWLVILTSPEFSLK
jgi:uncharacterized protein (DUF1800 family)